MAETTGDQPRTRTFYRILDAPVATHDDFRSDAERGDAPPRNPDKLRYWRGRSVFATLAQARAMVHARRDRAIMQAMPPKPEYIAAITIPVGGAITWEQWGRSPGHHTMWGDTDDIFAHVTAVYTGETEGNEL